jgi:hypothetical protein
MHALWSDATRLSRKTSFEKLTRIAKSANPIAPTLDCQKKTRALARAQHKASLPVKRPFGQTIFCI